MVDVTKVQIVQMRSQKLKKCNGNEKGMKKFVFLMISTCLLLVLIGCNPTPSSDFNLVFKYGVGAKNILDTFDGTFTRDMVSEPSITVELSLSEKELGDIYHKMAEINFVDYPDNFSVAPSSSEVYGIQTPYHSYYFKIQYNSKIKELWWEDRIVYEDRQADKLRELIRLIWDIVESKEEYKQLPEPTSGYQ